jgi:hypothetical protein
MGLGGLAVSIGVAALFLAFASVISFLAPVHVLDVQREDGQGIRADIAQRLLLFIPIHKRAVVGVRGVRTRTSAPEPSRR